MALILAEPFSQYLSSAGTTEAGTANDDGTTAWSSSSNSTDNTQGRFGARTLNMTTNGRTLRMRLGAIGATQIFGGAFKWDSSTSALPVSAQLLAGLTSGGAANWVINLGVGGSLYIFQAGGSTLVGTVPSVVRSDVWHYLEVKVFNDNAGTMVIRLDGVQIFSTSGIDFQNGTLSAESLSLGGNADNVFWEDVIVMDSTGATFNDFMGDMRYEIALVDADGATANWTASAGTRWQTIDDPLGTHDADTTYISSNTTDQDNYSSHVAIAATGATVIHFAELLALARADASGDEIALAVVSGATTDIGADIPLVNGTYRWRKKIWTVDPNTAAAWTVANINAAEWGVRKRV